MNIEKCLQQRNGSCRGCDIYTMASEKIRVDLENLNVIRSRIEKSYCPKGIVMQPIELPKQSIW